MGGLDSEIPKSGELRGVDVGSLVYKLNTSTTSTKIDLEKFTGKNDFNMWKVKMEALLIIQGLGDAIELVTKNEGKEVSSFKTPEMAAEIDKKVRSTIILSLGDSMIKEVANEKNVADLWAKSEKIYMTKSLANKLYIKRRMFTLKMAEGSSLDDHIDEFNQVCDTLETIDKGLDGEGKVLLLVSFLPQSYSNLVDALMYGRSTLSLDEVKAALNTRGLQEKSGNMMHAEGLSVKGKFNNNDGKKKKQKKDKSKSQNLKCFHCHKEGHFKKDCPELKNKNKERNGDAATVEEEGYESAGVCVATEDLQRGMGNVSLRLHDGTIWELREGSKIVMKGSKRNEVYVLDGEAITRMTDVIVGTGGESTRLSHLRLGHMSVKGLKELEKQGVLEKDKIEELNFCEDCVYGKSTRNSFKHSTTKSIGILDYIHFDLWGPVQTSSLGDFRTPFEMWHGKPASYANLKVFGCPAYAHVNQGKLAPRALKGQFLGYPDRVKEYKLWCTDLEPPKCIISRDVAFNEKVVLEIRNDAGVKTQRPQEQDNI
ncbi:hypothetical protein KPL71_004466 [Citrus sinensis]|uniref:Uncharacterized protein n=1 Tax=Citrus sinensis TaxID=2711 RepID=A0ACB8N535_CITSI|nr:hypothetical protein KPL71_004466 [Citrus sinensis]